MLTRGAAVTLLLSAALLAHTTTKAQYDTSTDVDSQITTETNDAGSITTFFEVTFYHDDVTDAGTGAGSNIGGSYSVSYYYAGCGKKIDLLVDAPSGLDLPVLSSAERRETRDPVSPPGASGKCGVTDNKPCAVASTFKYNMQALSDIPYTDIKSVYGAESVVKFCVRLSLNKAVTNGVAQLGWKEADVEVKWTTKNGFSMSAPITVNGLGDPDDEPVGAVPVGADLTSKATPLKLHVGSLRW